MNIVRMNLKMHSLHWIIKLSIFCQLCLYVTCCRPITIPMCLSSIPYSETSMPNFLNQTSQEDAGQQIRQYYPLVQIQCSQHLRLFLCSLYAPPCTETIGERVPPCRSLCLAAKAGCVSLLNQYGFQWPEPLNCDKFPLVVRCIDEYDNIEVRADVTTTENTTEIVAVTDVNPTMPDTCQPITLAMCTDLEYNMTGYHGNQHEAGNILHTFVGFVTGQCSPKVRLFLCSVYVPMCTPKYPRGIQPCKSFCRLVSNDCRANSTMSGTSWPFEPLCEHFPSSGPCLSANGFVEAEETPNLPTEERITKTENAIQDIRERMTKVQVDLFMEKTLRGKTQQDTNELQVDVRRMKKVVFELKRYIELLHEKPTNKYVLFKGIPETVNEATDYVVRRFISNYLKIVVRNLKFDDVYRSPDDTGGSNNKNIIVKFTRKRDAELILRKSRRLKGTGFEILAYSKF